MNIHSVNRGIFLFFASASAFLGVGMVIICNDLADVRGWIALLAAVSATTHLYCARKEVR